jgi:hypothetical protein
LPRNHTPKDVFSAAIGGRTTFAKDQIIIERITVAAAEWPTATQLEGNPVSD